MAGQDGRIRYLDAVVAVCLLAALVFVSPVVYLWTHPASPWFVPYVLWLVVILLAVWAWRQRTRHEP